MAKRIICRCEDITIEEIEDAIKNGFNDIESIKRYTGVGTGACQGKSCIQNAIKLLLEQNNIPTEGGVKTITTRAPLHMIPFKFLAGSSSRKKNG